MGTDVIKNEKILYYFGAGASAKALPLARSVWEEKLEKRELDPRVSDLKSDIKIKGLAHELRTFTDEQLLNEFKSVQTAEYYKELKINCQELASKADEFGDVDTYAKFLNLKKHNGEDFKKLKRLISAYFSIVQTVLQKTDSRYLPWLVAIMNEKRFPENVKILSWNYDYQVQFATNHFFELEGMNYYKGGFEYSASGLSYYPNLDPTFKEFAGLSLIHLNGIAGFAKSTDEKDDSIFQTNHEKDLENVTSFLMKNNLDNHLHFSWEGSNYHSDLMKHVSKMIEEVTIMVVIGYSFPFFNREVDKAVFKQLKESTNFKKIYYQDPILDGQQLKAQFELDKDFPIIHIRQTGNFHIPFEY